MSEKTRNHRRSVVIAAAALGVVLAGGTAWAYWTSGGSGSAPTTTKSGVAAVAVNQVASTAALAPGETVLLNGTLVNPNKTDIKVGTLTATVTAVSGGAAKADFVVSSPVAINAVVKKDLDLAWSGVTLTYNNSAINQDNGKNATVTVSYTLTPFVEPPAPPATGTFSYTSKVLKVQDVALWPTASGDMIVQAGDQLYVHVPAGGWDQASDQLVVGAVNGAFTFSSAPNGYFLLHDPGYLELKRGGVLYPRTPAWTL